MSKQKIIYIILLGLIVVFSFASWQNLKELLFNEAKGIDIFLFFASAAFLILGAFFGLMYLLFDGLNWLGIALVANIGIFLLFFGFKPIYLVAWGLGLAAMIFAGQQASQEKKIHLQIIPWEILRPALHITFIVFALIISLVLYFSPAAQSLKKEVKIPRSLFDLVLNSMTGFLTGKLDGQLNQPVPINLNLPGLPTINLSELNKGLAAQKISLDQILTQEAKDNLYQLANEKLNLFLHSYKNYLPYGLAIAVFLILRAVSFIFVWLAAAIVQAIFAIMKTTGLVKIKREMVEKETIEI